MTNPQKTIVHVTLPAGEPRGIRGEINVKASGRIDLTCREGVLV